MKQERVPGIGIAVFREGQMEWSGGFGVTEVGTPRKVTADTLFHACSMSKMVTAIGVLCLVQEGLLDLDEDVNRYLVSWQVPESPYTTRHKVTLRLLLAHQAGFVDPEGSFGVCDIQDPFPAPTDILRGNTRYYAEPAQVKYTPGSRFSYSDAGYAVVEQLVEDVTGEPFAAVMRRFVIEPFGLKRTMFWKGRSEDGADPLEIKAEEEAAAGHDPFGRVVEGRRAHYPNLSGAGLWTTPAEFASFTLEVIKAWNGDAQSVLRPDLARMMLTGQGCDTGVGLGVFLPHAHEPYMVSRGWGVGFQCMLAAYPNRKSGIVAMANSDPGRPQHESLIGEIIRLSER